MKPIPQRLVALLNHLNTVNPKPTPKHVGLKTMIVAKDLGYVTGEGEFPHRALLLTAKGQAYLRSIHKPR